MLNEVLIYLQLFYPTIRNRRQLHCMDLIYKENKQKICLLINVDKNNI